jgi:hypothetical protein
VHLIAGEDSHVAGRGDSPLVAGLGEQLAVQHDKGLRGSPVTVTVTRRRVPGLACRLKQRELAAGLLAGDQQLLRGPEKAVGDKSEVLTGSPTV